MPTMSVVVFVTVSREETTKCQLCQCGCVCVKVSREETTKMPTISEWLSVSQCQGKRQQNAYYVRVVVCVTVSREETTKFQLCQSGCLCHSVKGRDNKNAYYVRVVVFVTASREETTKCLLCQSGCLCHSVKGRDNKMPTMSVVVVSREETTKMSQWLSVSQCQGKRQQNAYYVRVVVCVTVSREETTKFQLCQSGCLCHSVKGRDNKNAYYVRVVVFVTASREETTKCLLCQSGCLCHSVKGRDNKMPTMSEWLSLSQRQGKRQQNAYYVSVVVCVTVSMEETTKCLLCQSGCLCHSVKGRDNKMPTMSEWLSLSQCQGKRQQNAYYVSVVVCVTVSREETTKCLLCQCGCLCHSVKGRDNKMPTMSEWLSLSQCQGKRQQNAYYVRVVVFVTVSREETTKCLLCQCGCLCHSVNGRDNKMPTMSEWLSVSQCQGKRQQNAYYVRVVVFVTVSREETTKCLLCQCGCLCHSVKGRDNKMPTMSVWLSVSQCQWKRQQKCLLCQCGCVCVTVSMEETTKCLLCQCGCVCVTVSMEETTKMPTMSVWLCVCHSVNGRDNKNAYYVSVVVCVSQCQWKRQQNAYYVRVVVFVTVSREETTKCQLCQCGCVCVKVSREETTKMPTISEWLSVSQCQGKRQQNAYYVRVVVCVTVSREETTKFQLCQSGCLCHSVKGRDNKNAYYVRVVVCVTVSREETTKCLLCQSGCLCHSVKGRDNKMPTMSEWLSLSQCQGKRQQNAYYVSVVVCVTVSREETTKCLLCQCGCLCHSVNGRDNKNAYYVSVVVCVSQCQWKRQQNAYYVSVVVCVSQCQWKRQQKCLLCQCGCVCVTVSMEETTKCLLCQCGCVCVTVSMEETTKMPTMSVWLCVCHSVNGRDNKMPTMSEWSSVSQCQWKRQQKCQLCQCGCLCHSVNGRDNKNAYYVSVVVCVSQCQWKRQQKCLLCQCGCVCVTVSMEETTKCLLCQSGRRCHSVNGRDNKNANYVSVVVCVTVSMEETTKMPTMSVWLCVCHSVNGRDNKNAYYVSVVVCVSQCQWKRQQNAYYVSVVVCVSQCQWKRQQKCLLCQCGCVCVTVSMEETTKMPTMSEWLSVSQCQWKRQQKCLLCQSGRRCPCDIDHLSSARTCGPYWKNISYNYEMLNMYIMSHWC